MGIFYPYIPHDGRAADRRRSGRRGHRHRPARGVAHAPGAPACCTATAPTCCRTRTARSSRRIRSRRASTIPASAPSTRGSRTAAAPNTWRSPTTRRSRRSTSCCRIEGIIPALESAHALAYAMKLAPTMPKDKILLVNLSGRGDKDMHTVAERSGLKFYCRPECIRRGADSHPRSRMNRIDATFAKLRAAGRTALIPYVTAGDPSPAIDRADHARAGGGRRRHHRARRAVLRSDGRRPGDPARVRARARSMASASPTCSALVASFARRDTTTPVVLMGYANPIEAMGVDGVRRPRARRRRRRRAGGRLSAGGGGRVRGAAGRARHRADLPAVADDARRAHRRGRRAWRAATSTTCR